MKSLPIDSSLIKDANRMGALARDLVALRQRIEATLGAEDLKHLRKVERWGWIATAIGAATCWIAPNPLSIAAISLGRATRWLLMHHLGHRGYDKVPNVPRRYTSRVFARGWRRWIDWRDYMLPEAWIYEHNVLHHAHTGDAGDPDLIERNTEPLRARLPKPARYAVVLLLGLTWRATYYAPQTTAQWLGRRGAVDRATVRRSLLLRSYLPFVLFSFVAPVLLAYFVLGAWAAASVLVNLIAADALTNLHTFFVVGPNHTGGDLYRFESPPASRDEYYLRQIIGTVNYRTGGEINDYLHLFLNYQIEHHLFPDLPMRQYQRIQPEVRALCAKHGIPYLQEGVGRRWRKMVRVIVGDDQMQCSAAAEAEAETENLELGAA